MISSDDRRPSAVSRDAWLTERRALLEREKAHTRERDALNVARRQLPWVHVTKPYRFDGVEGPVGLHELFAHRSQLIVRHFMFGPDWEEGCKGCSFGSDHMDGILPHLENHDVSYVAVSRAPLEKLMAFQARMGWRFRWVSSFSSDFNQDFGVTFTPAQMDSGERLYNYGSAPAFCDELPGLSVFFRDESGEVYHTYSAYGRGTEITDGAYMLLDLTPKGRNETGPNFNLMDWVKLRDQYPAPATPMETKSARGMSDSPTPDR
ncbi:DUF899 domain-containing protein [Synoicihabitans lomoniglobus]|uniref:Thioredoxin family protein n=1 Tax=Synoicihabitans lomoniglobus TaxID=2909285 RepID=A0AAE9ZSJ3_9BACT|nr:thioredoxin family protein [Opitutaceae bacterium LMO-M01]WED63466.1 thioredoxin family protein [Opitutaceae bacterium LMO-M01]